MAVALLELRRKKGHHELIIFLHAAYQRKAERVESQGAVGMNLKICYEFA